MRCAECGDPYDGPGFVIPDQDMGRVCTKCVMLPHTGPVPTKGTELWAGIEVDEQFMDAYVGYGLDELGTMLLNEARMDAAERRIA